MSTRCPPDAIPIEECGAPIAIPNILNRWACKLAKGHQGDHVSGCVHRPQSFAESRVQPAADDQTLGPMAQARAAWKETAAPLANAPAWAKAGVDLNPETFETYAPERVSASRPSKALPTSPTNAEFCRRWASWFAVGVDEQHDSMLAQMVRELDVLRPGSEPKAVAWPENDRTRDEPAVVEPSEAEKAQRLLNPGAWHEEQAAPCAGPTGYATKESIDEKRAEMLAVDFGDSTGDKACPAPKEKK